MLFCGVVLPAKAADAWDGSVADGFGGGSGTRLDPYIIKTPAELAYFAKTVSDGDDYEDEYIELSNDIVLNDTDMFAHD